MPWRQVCGLYMVAMYRAVPVTALLHPHREQALALMARDARTSTKALTYDASMRDRKVDQYLIREQADTTGLL